MKTIDTYSINDITHLFNSLKQPNYRIQQLLAWLYQRNVDNYNEMTNLPRNIRDCLRNVAPLIKPQLKQRLISKDGTHKYLIEYPDNSCVETVAIPSHTRKDRLTVCFSTQVGCAMSCSFCATGHEGYTRNLGSGEILRQIIIAQGDMELPVTNVVAMGQGEPFLNYDNVLGALQVINASYGLSIGARKITVSTCGILPGIERFAAENKQFTLAVSLHAAQQPLRNTIMPRLAHYPLDQLKQILCLYTKKTNRRVTLEYILLEGINDTIDDLVALTDFSSNLLCHINLIPMNSIEGSPYRASSTQTIQSWLSWFNDRGIETTIRASRGSDIDGACGQLKQTFG